MGHRPGRHASTEDVQLISSARTDCGRSALKTTAQLPWFGQGATRNNRLRMSSAPSDLMERSFDLCIERSRRSRRQRERGIIMSKICLAVITGAAFMAVVGIANAQGTGTGSSAATSSRCWDVSSNMVRDKNQTNASGTSSGNTGSTVGSTTSKRAMGTGAVGAGGAGSSSIASERPAGMPDC